MPTKDQLNLHEAVINNQVTNFSDKGSSVEFTYKGKTYTAQAYNGVWDKGSIKPKGLLKTILGK